MPTVIGYDTETKEGPPMTVQFYSEQLPKINKCIWVNGENVTKLALNHLTKHCKRGDFTVYGHNLTFDLLSLFYPESKMMASRYGDFSYEGHGWYCSGVYGRPTFCVLRNDTATITIVDTFSWFSTSLAKVAELVCPDVPKLKMPKDLGQKQFKRNDDYFIEYAMTDAKVAYHVGMQIDKMHDEFDLRQSLSVAHMASKIFEQHYINETAPIWNTGPDFNAGAVSSYHGGKNNVIPGAAPAYHTPVDAWDLSSAYPHAMTQIPAFSNPSLFQHAINFPKNTRRFPEHGIYCITGKAAPCDWPCVFDETFNPIRGPFENVWITGYELNEARRIGEISLSRVWGHIYDTDKDPVTESAFTRYVNHFYKLKQEASDPIYRYMYKVLLNSLYGKFIQSRQMETENGSVVWKHGQLYHPFAASLITGHTRSVMHRLEHETKALHTATDGIYCGAGNSPKDGTFSWSPQSGLGSIESEGTDMELGLLRNKLYVLYGDEPGNGWHSFHRKGKYVVKYAKHGFQGSPKQLEDAILNDVRSYTVNKPNTLKTALKQGRVPNKFEVRELTLNVAPITAFYQHENRAT